MNQKFCIISGNTKPISWLANSNRILNIGVFYTL